MMTFEFPHGTQSWQCWHFLHYWNLKISQISYHSHQLYFEAPWQKQICIKFCSVHNHFQSDWSNFEFQLFGLESTRYLLRYTFSRKRQVLIHNRHKVTHTLFNCKQLCDYHIKQRIYHDRWNERNKNTKKLFMKISKESLRSIYFVVEMNHFKRKLMLYKKRLNHK